MWTVPVGPTLIEPTGRYGIACVVQRERGNLRKKMELTKKV